MSPPVYMAPVPGAHKVTDRTCVYVRRPAVFNNKGTGSATAIKIEAYVPGNPLRDYGVAAWTGTNLSEPIFVTLVWVTADHRPTWDALTRGRVGNVATLDRLDAYVPGPDGRALLRAVNEALNAIEGWEAAAD